MPARVPLNGSAQPESSGLAIGESNA